MPRVDAIAAQLAPEVARPLRVEAARVAIAQIREQLRGLPEQTSGQAGHVAVPSTAEILAVATNWLATRARPSLQRVINATGVVIHTNLGRAPLPAEAISAALGYCNLEYDLDTGTRGSRRSLIEPQLCDLTGAEAALVVNNCAAALVLALACLERRTVIVSRGELVEIGGSFRIPDILASAGVTLREVGTTNRTYARDYADVIEAEPGQVGAVLRVHPSNFKISGFVARPRLDELRAAAGSVPLIVDLGSDALFPIPVPADDDTLADALANADLVTLSGDKLLGGPQAGLVLGRRAMVERMARHPLMRALRPDKLAIAALDYVLRARLDHQPERVPVLQMLALDRATLQARAERLAAQLPGAIVVPTDDPIGGGSHPETTLPGAGLAFTGNQLDEWQSDLRRGSPPVITTLRDERLVIALRTVALADESDLVAALVRTSKEPRESGSR